MKFNHIKEVFEVISAEDDSKSQLADYKAKSIIHPEGKISESIYLVRSGCLRTFYIKDGNEITFQFYDKDDVVILIDSFYNHKPSTLNLQAIEKSNLIVLDRKALNLFMKNNPDLKDFMFNELHRIIISISNQLLSFIKDTPTERYLDLMQNKPGIIKRIPQHYIASYLGINPVSLSRIKSRLFSQS